MQNRGHMPHSLGNRVVENVCTVVLGKIDAVRLTVTALLAGGHVLIEDRPGVGKTLLARSLARSLDLPYQRIQCTSDLLPVDIIGAQIYEQRTGNLTFRRGPVFTSVLVADELNRTPPRTQSALLECMAERSVTVERQTHELPDPFFVIATQNPNTSAGTYSLPESQLDRFLICTRIGYPETQDELEVVAREDGHRLVELVRPVGDADELLKARDAVQNVRLQADLVAYIVALAQRTRDNSEIVLGVSPRGAQALHRAARARASLNGRDYVVPDDVRELVVAVFGHRLTVRGGGGDAATAILTEILQSTASPD